MNLYDATALTVSFPNDLGGLLMQQHSLNPPLRARLHPNASSVAAAVAASSWGEEDAAVVVARCWALHDACLTDEGNTATTSPSCPDHTALNRPAIASPFAVGSRGAHGNGAGSSGLGGSGGGAAPSDLGVVLSRVPPDWASSERATRFRPATPPTPQRHVRPTGTAETPEEARLHEKAERRARRRAKRRASKGKPPLEAAASNEPPSARVTPPRDEEGSAFLFQGSITLLPLSVTVCELVLESDGSQGRSGLWHF